MAKDKKSFLLYTDLIHTVSQLPDDKAGALFKHILEYVNDKEPKTDDIIISIAFEPIRQALKRDLKRYEEIRERNRENARKRWDSKKSDNIQKDATACDGIPNNATACDGIPNNATACEIIPSHANHADNDIVNVIDSDNVNDIKKENKEKPLKSPKRGKPPQKKMNLKFPYSSEDFIKAWNVLVEMPKWKKKIEHAIQLSLDKLGKYEEAFAIELMERAISGNYQGVVFPDTDEAYQKWKKSRKTESKEVNQSNVNDIWNSRR